MEKTFRVEGMKCMHCRMRAQKALEGVAGVAKAEVDLETATARLVLSEDVADETIVKAIKEAGFGAVRA